MGTSLEKVGGMAEGLLSREELREVVLAVVEEEGDMVFEERLRLRDIVGDHELRDN